MTGHTLICNGFADDNRGGAALTIATIEALRAAGASADLLTLADPATSYPCTKRWAGETRLLERHELGLRTSRLRLAVSFLLALLPTRMVSSGVRKRILVRLGRFLMPTIDAHSAIVLKPGYVLVTRSSPGSLASLVTTTTPLIAAWASGVPTVGVGHSVVISDHEGGNLWERLSSLYVTRLLRKMTAIAVRDDASYDDVAAATEGAGTELRLFPDVALMFPWAEPPGTKDRISDATVRIGIAAGHGTPGPTAEQFGAAVHRLADGRPVEVAIIQQSTDPRDLQRAEVLRQHLVRQGTMARTFRPPPEMLQSIGLWKGVDMAIAARMHAALFCVIVGSPVRLLEGDPRKARQVMHAADLERVMAQDIDDIDEAFDDERYDDEVGAARAAWPEFVAWLAVQLDTHHPGDRS